MKIATLLLTAGLAGVASGQVFTYNGTGGSIPDNGGNANPLSRSITISDSYAIADLNLNLNGMTHTFVGDLIVSLSNGSTSVNLVNRPGVPEFSSFGWAYNLNGNYTFDDSASVTWDNVNNGVQDTAFNIASGSYLGENALAAFNGGSVGGTWTLTISDNAGIDIGALSSWSLTVRAVPAPAGFALLGLGGLIVARRRR